MARYMRERFRFLGIATPARRAATRSLVAAAKREADEPELRAAAIALWRLPEREYQYAACDLLSVCQRSLTAKSVPALRRLITTKSWWDTVDALASRVVGPLAERVAGVRDTMDAWSRDADPWLRRAAILHQLGFAERTDEARLFRYCEANLADGDFFIRKAIGWALRQHAYVAPQAVSRFLRDHADRLSALTKREAARHLG